MNAKQIFTTLAAFALFLASSGCNAPCNDARPFYTTARGFCYDARRNCTETANFRHPADNKIRNVAFVSVINF